MIVRKRTVLALGAVFVMALALWNAATPSAEAGPPPPWVVIDNGTVQLGIFAEGHLNAPAGMSSCDGTTSVGLRLVATNCEATAAGCTCEGWGAADETTMTSGHANDDEGGSFNMTVESFTFDAESAVSTVLLDNGLRVTHDYHPSSASDNMYEVDVTVENTSDAPVHLLYRRVMDWDIEPTPFSEFVTMEAGTASALVFTSNNGFASADPLDGPSDLGLTGSWTDEGPADHGALFDFDFGSLAPGASHSFVTFYGAAATEAEANAALAAVGAEAFSYGQPSTETGPTNGDPNTFIFAFGDVGGAPIFEPTPDDEEEEPTPCIPPLVGHSCEGRPGSGSVETATVPPSDATPAPTSPGAAPTQPQAGATSPTGGQGGVISAPDTGDGSGGGHGSAATTMLIAIIGGGLLLAAAGGARRLVSRRR